MAKDDEFVLDGATIECSMGDKSATLKVTSNFKTFIKDSRVATEMDCTNANMFPPLVTFGTCKPYKAVPPPGCLCTFIPTGPWKGTYEKKTVSGHKCLIGSSYLICPRAAGKITIKKTKQ
ncbi:DUF4280 domain-containing protein [Apibacter sp. HY039]|uniref:DUF4280 domain-containing protein n=1 Tax=Apibacter sp. HY039 TaxID=2501476 RepID=UPI000FEBEF1F|nr:DUF4280 domain-containing protein [Apibacter sp. HY039]